MAKTKQAEKSSAVVDESPPAQTAVAVVDRETRAAALANLGVVESLWTPEQARVVRQSVCVDADDAEFAYFASVCQRTGLDPFTKQIYFVKRYNKDLNRKVGTIQIGIDGFRVLAQRTGLYKGRTGPYWCGVDGQWVDVWLKPYDPTACRVIIHRKGWEHPVIHTVRFSGYVQTTQEGKATKFWAGMGVEMLAKCAEAGGLRAAFPNDLSGLYLHEEMLQADEPTQEAPRATPAEIVTTALGIATTEDDQTATQGDADTEVLAEMYGDKAPEVESLATTGEDIQRDQMRDRDYLLALCRDLEKAWKKPASVAKESPSGSGQFWFINRDLLLECGHADASGAAVQMAFYDCHDEARRIGPEQCYSLCVAVQSAIDTHNNKGRKTRAVHPNEA